MSKKIKIRCQRGWIAYPGSTIQQNYAEDVTHGYLLWNVNNGKSFDVQFRELPNPKPFITIEWQGSVDATVTHAKTFTSGARFRIRTKDVLTQKEVVQLTNTLRSELLATEVTFKTEHQINRDVISAGGTTIVKDDLRNADVLLRLLKDYYKDSKLVDVDWDAIREQITIYLRSALSSDDIVRNTKWSLRHLKFDNMFTYGDGNVINFENLNGIVGIFGPNRVGKSSIIGTLMYALFNTTDRGSVKNLHVVNARHPYCYTKAVVNVNGTNYILERQTTKHETKKGLVHAGTALNVFKIDENGEAIDLAGEQRTDTEKVIKKLIGTADDCLLTSIAAQDDVKLFINQGTTKRRKDLSRFLDLDTFDKMYELAKMDVNANKHALRTMPERDWATLEQKLNDTRKQKELLITEKDHLIDEANSKLHEFRLQMSNFKDFTPVTKTQVQDQKLRVASLTKTVEDLMSQVDATNVDIARSNDKIEQAENIVAQHDLAELKRRIETYRVLESSFESLKHVYDKDFALLKQQQRSLQILNEVPCGDSFPDCKFIRDAFSQKDIVEAQREKVERVKDKLAKAEVAFNELKAEGLIDKVAKIEQLKQMVSRLRVTVSDKQLQLHKLQSTLEQQTEVLNSAKQRLSELEEALKNEDNVEAITIRNSLEDLQKYIKRLDAEKLALAADVGRIQSDQSKLDDDRLGRQKLFQLMKAHELIAQAFSRRGLPNLIVSSQLPIINAEIAKILNGIVNFTIELQQDDESDSMDVFIDYGDSKRIIELGSGMEKTIAAIAIRVALINISSLPKTDMFIVDESFGPLDPGAVESCNRLLTSLKRYFKTIIVITHVEGVKDIADHVIEVTKTEHDAKVMYDDLATTLVEQKAS